MAAEAASGETKRDIVVDAAGVLGYLAVRHGDDVGLLHGSLEGMHYVPPKSGEDQLERRLRRVHDAVTPVAPASAMAQQLDYALRYLKGRLLIVGVADEFMPDARAQDLLRRLAARHEVLWFTVKDAVLAVEGPAATSRGTSWRPMAPEPPARKMRMRKWYRRTSFRAWL